MPNNKTSSPPKKQSLLINLLVNVVIPAVILSKLSGDAQLGPVWGLIVALSFPIIFGVFELKRAGKVNFFSALGIISVLLTGGVALLRLDASLIAIKEALIPGLIGLIVLLSQFTPYPLIKKFLLSSELLNSDLLYKTLTEQNNIEPFEQQLKKATYLVAASFFLSSALNYFLAKIILVSPTGSSAFNEELGRMTWLSYPVIVLPSMVILAFAIFAVFKSIAKLTGQEIDTFLN